MLLNLLFADNATREAQLILLDFLNADIDLAHTFLDLAKAERDLDPPAVGRLLDKVTVAIEAVRHFLPRVADAQAAADIVSRVDELEAEMGRM